MTQPKHTQGPWKWTNGWAMGSSDEPGHSCVQNNKGQLVFYSCDGCNLIGDDPEDLANARLIAAAPDLLDACERALEAIEKYPDKKHPMTAPEIIMRAAVRKAKGEA